MGRSPAGVGDFSPSSRRVTNPKTAAVVHHRGPEERIADHHEEIGDVDHRAGVVEIVAGTGAPPDVYVVQAVGRGFYGPTRVLSRPALIKTAAGVGSTLRAARSRAPMARCVGSSSRVTSPTVSGLKTNGGGLKRKYYGRKSSRAWGSWPEASGEGHGDGLVSSPRDRSWASAACASCCSNFEIASSHSCCPPSGEVLRIYAGARGIGSDRFQGTFPHPRPHPGPRGSPLGCAAPRSRKIAPEGPGYE